MLFSMIRDGYIARKSSEMTHSYNPGWRLCTYPPSICSTRPPRIFIIGTATWARSAARIRMESMRFDVRPHGPPDVREDAAVDPPEPLAEVEEVREVAGELEPRNPVLRGPIDQHGQVVAVDVVAGDDVRVELVDELDEPFHDLPLVPLEDAGLDLTGFAVRDADAENVPVLDAVLDVEAQHTQSRSEGFARLETVRDQEQIGRVPPDRVGFLPVDADRGTEIHVVNEPMLERDVGLQRSGSIPAGLLAVFGRFPRLTEDDAGARRRPAFDLKGHVLELDDLRIPPERSAKRLRRLDDEEVRLEPRIFDRDAAPFSRAPEQLDDRQLRWLGGVPRFPSV